MSEIRITSGIYAWTDPTRGEDIFKLGCGKDILTRIEDERQETSNAGSIYIKFIFECQTGFEKNYESLI